MRKLALLLLLVPALAFGQKISNLPAAQPLTGTELVPLVQNGLTVQTAASNLVVYPRTAAEIAAGVTPVNYGYPVGTVDRYGTNVSPGTTVMLTAIQNAFKVVIQQGGGTVTFLPVQYYLGSFGSPSPLIELTNPSNIVIQGTGATIVVNTQTPGPNAYTIIDLQNPNNIVDIGLSFLDTGGNEAIGSNVDGARAWALTATGSANSGGVSIIGGTYTNIVSPVDGYWTSSTTGRVQGIYLNYRAVDCYYGANFADQGDDVTGSITAIDSRRAYFIYGVTGHDVTVNLDFTGANTGGANASIDVKRYQFDTRGDIIHAFYHGVGTYAGSVRFETEGNAGTYGVTALGSITGGSGYTNGVYYNVPLTGGSGTGAIGQVDVSGGAVTAVRIVFPGSGYATSDTLSAAAASIGGTGSGFSVPVTFAGASISDVEVDLSVSDFSPGTGWEPVVIDSLTSGGSLQSPTPDSFNNITIRGTGQAATFGGAPINIQSTQDTTGNLFIEGSLVKDTIGQTFLGFVAISGTSILGTYTVSGLPACNTSRQYFTSRVTDATSPTYNGALTGGGAVIVPVFCNGTSWTSH